MEFLIPIACFALIGYIINLGIRSSERKTLLKHGKDPYTYEKARLEVLGNPKETSPSLRNFKWGIILLAIGLSIGIGRILVAIFNLYEPEVIYISMVLIFGGAAMIATHILEAKYVQQIKEKQNKEIENSENV